MPHLDEGTLHALLDGELDLTEVSEVQLHLGTCVACGSRLQEVKQVLAEADRLVGAVEPPAASPRPKPEPPRRPPPPSPGNSDAWERPPVLLLPDDLEALARRNRRSRRLRWAAAIGGVLIAGRVISSAMGPSHPELAERDLTAPARSVPPAVVSPEESRRAEAPVASQRGKATRLSSQNRVAPIQKAASPKPEAFKVEDSSESSADTAPSVDAGAAALAADDTATAQDSQLLAAQDAVDSTKKLEVAAAAAADSETEPKAGLDERSRREDELATRRAAAQALAELDRERIRQRANAATAALPPPARPEQPTAAESAPAPRTLEQRSQIYLRIGLDEAVKQLGRPVHVIEGMTPQFIGLIRGQQVPGANPRRPVVRVVYLDARGRMILLDQQRMDAGAAPGAAEGNLRWTIGDVMLYLRGEPGPDVLKNLQARVR
jgi:anti-sigma factor RsiW